MLHEWGYTYHGENTMYELTPREIQELQKGYRVLQEQRRGSAATAPDGTRTPGTDLPSQREIKRGAVERRMQEVT